MKTCRVQLKEDIALEMPYDKLGNFKEGIKDGVIKMQTNIETYYINWDNILYIKVDR